MRAHRQQEAATAAKARTAFQRFQEAYGKLVRRVVAWRWLIVPLYLVGAALVVWLVGRRLGTEIFPNADAGQLALRLRAPAGTRVENTEAIALKVLDLIKREAGAGQRGADHGPGRRACAELPDQPHPPLERRPGGRLARRAVQTRQRHPRRVAQGTAARGLRARTAGRALLLRAERHRQPRHELWRQHAHRGGRQRPQPRRERRARPQTLREAQSHPLPARRAVRAVARLSDRGRERGPRTRRPARGEGGRCDALAGRRDHLEPFHRGELLGRPQIGRQLQPAGADSADEDHFAGGLEECPGCLRGRQEPSCCATSPP